MLIHELFVDVVTREIPPVVYFHDQDAARVAEEVREYIFTGGWPEGHPNHTRVPNGIHEQCTRLLTNVAKELELKESSGGKKGANLPNAWISGFYGSGKSSFAKLLGLSLDGLELPDHRPLAQAWLERDRAPRREELGEAWSRLQDQVQPLAVVFDVGLKARSNEHVHSVIVRQVQARLGYCHDALVADYELRLEREGKWQDFLGKVEELLERPWDEVKTSNFVDDAFSKVLAAVYPDLYADDMTWRDSREADHNRSESPEEAVQAIADMLAHRAPEATLFLVIDEVSQYVLGSEDRVDRLRAFSELLGAKLRGRVWLLALGQQKLDEEADDSVLKGLKARFPPKFRVHLSATNIRDVVNERLLKKTPEAASQIKALFEEHRPELSLYAYGCEETTPDEFAEVYPMPPGFVDLLLQITSAMRTRSPRSQGDDNAIRGLLQLLGELFRTQKLAEKPLRSLVTLDQVYEVQHTALDSDAQDSMARIHNQVAHEQNPLLLRAAKAVALLELIQDTLPTDARVVAQCLYERIDQGSQVKEVTEALEELKRRNLLSYSEKLGYKLQSSAGEAWERERREVKVTGSKLCELVQKTLGLLIHEPSQPKHQGRPFPWGAVFSDGNKVRDARIHDPRKHAVVRVDFRYLNKEDRTASRWVAKTGDDEELQNRLVWVVGATEDLKRHARELLRSEKMKTRYEGLRNSLPAPQKLLLQEEANRCEDLERIVREQVAKAWLGGTIYFRGRKIDPTEHGTSFALALEAVGNQLLPMLFPDFVSVQVQPSELDQLLQESLSGLAPTVCSGPGGLGIFEVDAGKYVSVCKGEVPKRVAAAIADAGGIGGADLLRELGGPPCGWSRYVVKACAVGLLRAGQLKIQPESGTEITAVRDVGVKELFSSDRAFNNANFFPAGDDDIGYSGRAKICKFFQQDLGASVERENDAIANAALQHFPALATQLRNVQARLARLPGSPEGPKELGKLHKALEDVIRICRQTLPTVKKIKSSLTALRDGVRTLKIYDKELDADALRRVLDADETASHHGAQLRESGDASREVVAALDAVTTHLDSDVPWREVHGLEPALTAIQDAYVAERMRLLEWQESEVERVRRGVMARTGFERLDSDERHSVLRPLTVAKDDTSEQAIAPSLTELHDPFLLRLKRAEERSNEALDELLSRGDEPMIRRIELGLRNREVSDAAEVDALVEEVRQKLLAALGDESTPVRVRIR